LPYDDDNDYHEFTDPSLGLDFSIWKQAVTTHMAELTPEEQGACFTILAVSRKGNRSSISRQSEIFLEMTRNKTVTCGSSMAFLYKSTRDFAFANSIDFSLINILYYLQNSNIMPWTHKCPRSCRTLPSKMRKT
jgi:hypothetical protein